MAGEYREYRKKLLEQQQTHEKDELRFGMAVRIRFYVSLLLFLCYIFLDYTGINLYSVNSSLILQEIRTDLSANVSAEGLLAYLADQISITEETP